MKYSENQFYYPWLEEQTLLEGKIPKKINDKALIKKLTFGVASERAFNLLRLSPADFKGFEQVRVEGEINYKLAWLVDVIAHVFVTQNNNSAIDSKKDDIERIDYALVKKDNESFLLQPIVSLDIEQFNKILGKRVSKKQFEQLVNQLYNLSIEGFLKARYNPETKEWSRVGIQGRLVSEIKKHQLGTYWSKKYKIRSETKIFVFNTSWGYLFLRNLMNRSFLIKPRKLYSMSRSAQCIYNFIMLQPSSFVKVKIGNLQKIIGLESSNVVRLQRYIESGLNALKDNKYITGWSRNGKGSGVIYTINKTSMFIL